MEMQAWLVLTWTKRRTAGETAQNTCHTRMLLKEAAVICRKPQQTQSHTRTVVRECCKGDDASQCENGKFVPLPPPNPLTDRHKKLHT